MPIRLADPSSTAPVTSIRISFCAPSPSRTTCSARSSRTSSNAAANSSSGPASLPAAPVANSSTVSLVEVSLSTVVQLKLRSAPADTRACNGPAGIAASVNTKQSIVAMSGAIMPLPFAMPVIRTVEPAMVAVRVDAFGKVSVVMMPRAAASHATGDSAACRAGSAAVIRSGGSTSPITPVLARNTSLAGQPSRAAAASAVAFTVSRPRAPVKTLALPAFTTMPRARPPPSAMRHQSTGAPGHLLRVNTPATVLPGASSIITRSVRPWYRMPAAAAASRTPASGGSAGSGTARGDSGSLAIAATSGRLAWCLAWAAGPSWGWKSGSAWSRPRSWACHPC